jgi:hypothetical protein
LPYDGSPLPIRRGLLRVTVRPLYFAISKSSRCSRQHI